MKENDRTAKDNKYSRIVWVVTGTLHLLLLPFLLLFVYLMLWYYALLKGKWGVPQELSVYLSRWKAKNRNKEA